MMNNELPAISRGVNAALQLMPGSKADKCNALGISYNTMWKWQTGLATPTDDNLARIAHKAGVEQEWIRNGGSDSPDPDPVKDLADLIMDVKPNNDIIEQIRNLILHRSTYDHQ